MVPTINFPVSCTYRHYLWGLNCLYWKKEIGIKKNAEKAYGYHRQIKGYNLWYLIK